MSRWFIPDNKNYVMVPNLLLDYHKEIGIDDKELIFLIKLSRHTEWFKVHDNQLVPGCQKTAQRRRNSLEKKRLIRFQEHKESYIDENGKKKWITKGFSYDLSIINHKLERLAEDKFVLSEDKTVPDDDKNVSDEDKIGSNSGQKRPPYKTINKTNDKTINKSSSSRTTTTNILSPEVESVYSSYKEYVDPEYIITDVDIKSIKKIDDPEKLVRYIKYWKEYIDPYKSNRTLTDYEKKNTSKIWLIVDLWNDFKTFAQNKLDSESNKIERDQELKYREDVKSRFNKIDTDELDKETFKEWKLCAVSDDEYMMDEFLMDFESQNED